jgi:hypothetical protein
LLLSDCPFPELARAVAAWSLRSFAVGALKVLRVSPVAEAVIRENRDCAFEGSFEGAVSFVS